jgi:hypothetical protein
LTVAVGGVIARKKKIHEVAPRCPLAYLELRTFAKIRPIARSATGRNCAEINRFLDITRIAGLYDSRNALRRNWLQTWRAGSGF